jgi:alkylation response protein AidB-like acyl-CoA dehydrogenase
MMRFAFTDDQIAFADGVRAVLNDRCPPSVVRSAWNGDRGPADLLWRRLAGVGLFGALVPEADGGLGLDELDLLLCLEESGRAAVPLPLVETAVVAARLLVGTAHSGRLAELAGGDLRVSATLDGSLLLPWAGFCEWGLVQQQDVVHLVDVHGVQKAAGENVSAVDRARPVIRLSADACAASAGTSLVSDDPRRIGRARRAGMLATAAQLIGLGERMLWTTVEYVKERHQFGVPIGSFQAVKHALANALLALELARPLVHSAAWTHVNDRNDADRDVAAAKIRAGEAAGLAARTALQCHGGMGYTQEYDLHLWLKRTWALQASWGQAGELRALVAQSLGVAQSQGIAQSLGIGGADD